MPEVNCGDPWPAESVAYTVVPKEDVRAQPSEFVTREDLLQTLAQRVRNFKESGDASLVLGESATIQAQQLAELITSTDPGSGPVDVEAHIVLGGLYLCRVQALPDGANQADRAAAVRFLAAMADASPKAIDDAFRRYLPEVSSTPADPGGPFSDEANRLFAQFKRTGDLHTLNAAVELFGQAVAATAAGHPGLAMYLSNLGAAMHARFEQTGDAGDLEGGLAACQQAVDITPTSHPDRAMYLTNLAGALTRRFQWTGQLDDIDAAIIAGQEAVDVTAADHPNRAMYQSNLGVALRTRFEHAGRVGDLDAAITIGQQAVDATPAGNPSRAGRLSNLGVALRSRFEQTGDARDLDAALAAEQQALDATPIGHPNRASRLHNLGVALLTRFEQTGDARDLDAALAADQQALDATPIGHPDRASRLSNLGAALRARFEQTGQDDALDAALAADQQALDATPIGHPDRASRLSNLGFTLRTRSERTGDARDLDAAIAVAQQAVDATPVGHPMSATYLTNLGAALARRFEWTADARDLDAAVAVAQQALDATSAGHPDRSRRLSNVGAMLQARFDQSGDARDLDAAIAVGQQAVDATGIGHPDRARMLSNFGFTTQARFRLTGDLHDLDAAIAVGQQAVDATPAGHPDRARMLSNVGVALRTRFEQTGQAGDLDAAIQCWREAAKVDTAWTGGRIWAARAWGGGALEVGDIASAADGYAAGVALLPQAAWHGLDRALQEEQLASWAGLATDAAACAISAGQLHRAVEVLEQGRSVLWTQALHLRSDLTRLYEHDPDLAARLDAIRRKLDRPMRDATVGGLRAAAAGEPAAADLMAQEQTVEERRQLARQWDELVARVRQLDGFEHFLSAVPFAELQAAASAGPVVIVNASRLGCHALIITTTSDTGVLPVPLPDLTYEKAVDQARTLLRTLSGASQSGQPPPGRHVVFDVLEWLWQTIAAPVLASLGHTGPSPRGTTQPRLWWYPTGPLTLLPLHAAGRYQHISGAPTQPEETVPGRVISSYTPTLAGLRRAQEAPTPITHNAVPQLVVGLPTTPGQNPLPAVPSELQVLTQYLAPPRLARHLVGEHATRAAVLGSLGDYPWVHFACHAYQDEADPAGSAFALWDGPLTIADLTMLRMNYAELAFLSACQTATGSALHLDEAIHLAAAMQFLGYRHVIATLWTIADAPAPNVANTVYAHLTQTGRPDASQTAEALHRAVEKLRNVHPSSPLLWAPYVHIGP